MLYSTSMKKLTEEQYTKAEIVIYPEDAQNLLEYFKAKIPLFYDEEGAVFTDTGYYVTNIIINNF